MNDSFNSKMVNKDDLLKFDSSKRHEMVKQKLNQQHIDKSSEQDNTGNDINGKIPVATEIHYAVFSEDCASHEEEFKNYKKQQNKGDEDK